jgi:hypothetical protein
MSRTWGALPSPKAMAALATSAVTPYPVPGDIASSEWASPGKGNRAVYTRRCKVVLTAQGTAANPVPAAAFGFSKLLSCGILYDKAGAKGIPAVVDPTANTILFCGGASGAPADVTSADAYITVEGVI